MTRYSSFSGLEKAVWYFAPDGMAYENPIGGFTEKDLAAHPGRVGTAEVVGEELRVSWTGGSEKGKVEGGSYEPSEDGETFNWDLGIFTPVEGFAPKQGIEGKWQGGFSTGSGGNSGAVARTLELRADGTFSLSGSATLSATDSTTTATAGAVGAIDTGKWSLAPYTLTLGQRKAIAFPWDDEETPVNPDQFYFDGIMWSRLSE